MLTVVVYLKDGVLMKVYVYVYFPQISIMETNKLYI